MTKKNKKQKNLSDWNSTQDFDTLLKIFSKYDFANIIPMTCLNRFLSDIVTEQSKRNEPHLLNVSLPKLFFSFKADQMSVIPHSISMIYVILSLQYEYSKPYLESKDIFSFYQLDLVINSEGKVFAWHLDRETNTDGKFFHPLYHFHGGGKKIEDKNAGELLILSSPRLAHPPMDLFLAIHFILENFLNTQTYEMQAGIFKDPLYKDIIIRAQKRVLDPYFSAFSSESNWEGYYQPHSLCPLYLKQ